MNMIERHFTLIDYCLTIQILARVLVIKAHLGMRINFIPSMPGFCKWWWVVRIWPQTVLRISYQHSSLVMSSRAKQIASTIFELYLVEILIWIQSLALIEYLLLLDRPSSGLAQILEVLRIWLVFIMIEVHRVWLLWCWIVHPATNLSSFILPEDVIFCLNLLCMLLLTVSQDVISLTHAISSLRWLETSNQELLTLVWSLRLHWEHAIPSWTSVILNSQICTLIKRVVASKLSLHINLLKLS